MLLKIYFEDQVFAYKDIDKTFFRTRSFGGMKYLQFDISTKHALYKYFSEETQVEYDGDLYLVKGVSERSSAKICTINCELDLSGLDSRIINKTFETESFYNVCKEILSGTGWTVTNAELISKHTTLEVKDKTPREVLNECTNTTNYGVCYEINTKKKEITCIKPLDNTAPTGVYFTDELNLSELSLKGSSSSLVTRLYVYGKDGTSIADVNDGKEYIDNFTYTNKIICGVWRDERYTHPQTQKDDAEVKLAAMAVPERSYTCKVLNLAKASAEKYGDILSYDLYDVASLVDRNRKTRINHRIVEVREYPADETLDTVTLSSIAGKITGKLTDVQNRVTQLDARQLHDRKKVNEIKQDLDTTVLHISESWASSTSESLITQTADGIYLEVKNIIGEDKWSTKLQQSSEDIRISWNNISRNIRLERGEMNIYETADAEHCILSVHSQGMSTYDSSGTLLMNVNKSGQHFYSKGNKVGKIGTNRYKNNDNKRGLVFDLEKDASYMAWGRQDVDSGLYKMKLAYVAPDENIGVYSGSSDSYKDDSGNNVKTGQLHTGCSIDMHNWFLRNAVLEGISAAYNGEILKGYTGEIPIIQEISGTELIYSGDKVTGVKVLYTHTKLKVSNGIIIGFNA